ncbi:MAG TPA: Nif3-like dinuclear metal center hexameric protein [Fimbriimonas sp.]|nr:Nif3-like dinuclear metal center hexameric protein [Fimbriimonas sp.]
MALVRDVLDALEKIAPQRYAFPFDKVGLQVGNPHSEVRRAAVSLDRSLGAISFAKGNDCQLLLSHHPLIFTPLETVDTRSHVGRSVVELVRNDISFIAAHTNWDSALGGINDALVDLLGLEHVKAFGTASEVARYKLVFFCPEDCCQRLIDAVSEAGAGSVGLYSRCAFFSEGTGTFVAGEGTNPAVGSQGGREEIRESRVELVVPSDRRRAVVRALEKNHPYEEPAYELYLLDGDPEQAAGRVGELPQAITLQDLAGKLDSLLHSRCWTWGGRDEKVRKIAVVGGAADGEWMFAQRAGADVLVTGEVKQHVAVEAGESGMKILAAGHYATEQPGCVSLKGRMADALPEIEWLLYVPDEGRHGRPW